MYAGKPIIGLSGGIGAGKSFVGSLFAELGCLVINSDELSSQVYQDPSVKQILRDWWGDAVFRRAGECSDEVDRAAVGRKVFNSDEDRKRLEGILHPRIARLRETRMKAGAADPRVVAFVWDSPLLFETQISSACDATVFVDAPETVRWERVRQSRGWDAAELARREKSQMPLDKKRLISDYVLVNATDADSIRVQVRGLLSRILAGAACTTQAGDAPRCDAGGLTSNLF
jgi:dephospho-CoA kinase